MCIAIPGKIIKIGKKTAIVQYPHGKQKVLLDPNIPVTVGNTVRVQMGVVVEKI